MKMNFARVTQQLALAFGDREALVNVERGRRFTHVELDAFTNRVANMMIQRLALRRGDTYMCILDNDNLSLLHVWTAFKGEARLAMTNYRDSPDEHRWQFEFISPKVVFIENALIDTHAPFLLEKGIRVVCMDPPPPGRADLLYFWDLLEGVPATNPGVEHEVNEDIMVFRFTGGTTGKSKCARYTVDNWLAIRDAAYALEEQGIGAHSRFLHMAPISHASGLSILPVLFRGGCTVTQNTPDLQAWCRNVEQEKITTTLLVPTLLYRLLELPEATQYDLSTLQTINYGAAPMSPAKLRLLLARFGNVFAQGYAATECLQRVAALTKADHVGISDARLASAGRVTPGVELMIADEEGRELPRGTTGEIWLRCRATISGYYRNPEGTAAEFQDGFWKSGDMGYLDEDGFLFIVDRKKDVIITGGFNVYAVEVEAALNAHPAVANSAVVGVPHEEWGEAVHAEVELHDGQQVDEQALIDHVKSRIGRFKAPKSISFVERLPVTVVGKVVRRIVREKYWKDRARSVS
ncbi:class I adenylate-forming enzyme family protein [Paraburkholderia pallida]|uniref:Long-chain fatty acid--CoA ligase n=1 Tax=Paraburkholderia pallida TaxID=2547399 RepID=A0A4P7D3H9_9BURK|nr:AMP-binding protein [Paraburkholderia pallida]QBR01132.1 long-chain fatty acid--CoA ligase [Paraburkholderia pallida]